MRSFLALFVAMALFALVSAGGMVPCPFLTANKSCCPRSHAPEKKCPLSESLDNCPFFYDGAEDRDGGGDAGELVRSACS